MEEEDFVIDAPPPPAVPAAAKPKPKEKAAKEPAAPKGKKGAEGNPCRGSVKKTKGKAAEHVPGDDARPPTKFDAERVCELCDLWWEAGKGDNFVVHVEDNWDVWPMKTIKQYVRKVMKEHGMWISTQARKDSDEVLAEIDEVLLNARVKRRVDEMLPGLAGYRAGVHELRGGRRVIVQRSPQIIEPVEGDWSLIRELIEGRLKLDDVDQSDYFYSWCKVSYESLVTGSPGNYTPGHILVLAGEVGAAKSRLQTNILTPLLGGREGDPTPSLTGEDIFNSDLMESEHWSMEELKGASQKTIDRVRLSEAFKAAAVEEKKRMRLMRTNPVTVYPFIRVSLSMNSSVEKMRAFPMLTNDFRDKVIMLKVQKRPLPMPTETTAEKAAFNKAVAAQMPAFCWWLLNEYEIPEKLKNDAEGKRQVRFGFASWQHPELAEQLYDDTPHAQWLRLIDEAEFEHKVNGSRKLWGLVYPHNKSGRKDRTSLGQWQHEPGVWQGTAEELEKLLCGETEGIESSVKSAALKLARHGEMSHRLASLKEDQANRIDYVRTNAARHWRIAAPQASE